MELFDKTQSSRKCLPDGCFYTENHHGTHWFQVSMNDTQVSQIELKAESANLSGEEVSVLLYHGETQVGACDLHSGNAWEGAETLSCDELVTANRVNITFTTKKYSSNLALYAINVTGLVTGKSDL